MSPGAVLHELRRLIEHTERDSHVAWVWGGTRGTSVIVVYRWMRESTLVGFHRDVVELGQLFEPVDELILAEIMAVEIEESGKRSVDVPEAIIDAVPVELRRRLDWMI